MTLSGGRSGPPTQGPAFLERSVYRRRRLVDAARLLPVLGMFLFAIPLLWTSGETAAEPDAVLQTSHAVMYVFGMWVVLIVLAVIVSRHLIPHDPPQKAADAQDP